MVKVKDRVPSEKVYNLVSARASNFNPTVYHFNYYSI